MKVVVNREQSQDNKERDTMCNISVRYTSFFEPGSETGVISGLSSKGVILGRLPFGVSGDVFIEERSDSLGPRLSWPGVERPDRAVLSASSFRSASNSRSNLPKKVRTERRKEQRYVLAAEHFNVEPAPIPDTHCEYRN